MSESFLSPSLQRDWLKYFLLLKNKVVTKKPAETRQGGGKGAPDHWVSVVKRGRIMFELGGIEESMARRAAHLAGYKLPIATSFMKKEEIE